MADSKLKIDIRRNKILERLQETGVVRVAELSRDLGVTPVTVRTDLDILEREGRLDRVQGGAVAKKQAEASGGTMTDREKMAIAREAVKRIHDGSTLFINSGTTTQYFAHALKNHKGINVVTNSVDVALELGEMPSIRVILLGGEINAQYGYTCGEDAREQLYRYRADWAVLSVDGISVESGITTFHADEMVIDRLMQERAQRTMIVADSSKIGKKGFTCLCGINAAITLITDESCDENEIKMLEKNGMEVIFASA